MLYGLLVNESVKPFLANVREIRWIPYASELHAYSYYNASIIKTPADLRALRFSPELVFPSEPLRYERIELVLDEYTGRRITVLIAMNRFVNSLYYFAHPLRKYYYDIPEKPDKRKLSKAFERFTRTIDSIRSAKPMETIAFSDPRGNQILDFETPEARAKCEAMAIKAGFAKCELMPGDAFRMILDRMTLKLLAGEEEIFIIERFILLYDSRGHFIRFTCRLKDP